MSEDNSSDQAGSLGDSATVLWRYSKVWEGEDAFLVLAVQALGGGRRAPRVNLILDARQSSVGFRIQEAKPEALKPQGAVVALLRKYAGGGGLGCILRHDASGDMWLPLYTERQPEPTHWLQLALSSPPEVRLISTQDRMVLVRRSTKGTYTKKRPVEGELPPSGGHADGWTRAGDALWAQSLAQENAEGAHAPAAQSEAEPGDRSSTRPLPSEESVPKPSAAPGETMPEYQRQARDRMARRTKTVRKALTATRGRATDSHKGADLERQARLLAANLHRVTVGAHELLVDAEDGLEPQRVCIALDPERSAGHNLDALYVAVKKARKAQRIATEQIDDGMQQLASLEADLALLRARVLPPGEVERILTRHKLRSDRPVVKAEGGMTTPVATPFRTYWWSESDGARIPIWVGKGASANDELCRSAKSNDHWIHAVGCTGSHVIIPAKAVKGALPPGALRAAAILALAHSEKKQDMRGEVYVTRRQFLKKRPGMPPGLWQVDKAEILFLGYDAAERARILELQDVK